MSEKAYTISDMKEKDYSEKIRERVSKLRDGELVVMVDFADIAPNNTVNKIVTRLVDENLLRPIIRGVYQKPQMNSFLGEPIEPTGEALAVAIARKNGWTICPNGDTALNLLGLSTQVPANWSFLSNGPYKVYKFSGGEIRFSHTANRLLESLSKDSVFLVQALRALGEENTDDETLMRLSHNISSERINLIEAETRNVPDWIRSKIAKLKEIKNA